MNNIELIFDYNPSKVYGARFNPKSKYIEIRQYKGKEIDGSSIKELVAIFSGIIEKYGVAHPPIFLDLINTRFRDKLTYITLECILECLITKYHFDVVINMSVKKDINASGLKDSPIIDLTDISKNVRKNYSIDFRGFIHRNHFRRVVIEGGDSTGPSKAFDDLCDFMRFCDYDLDEGCMDEISLVIAELISNAVEHGGKECLVDVDIEGGFIDKREEEPKKEYIVLSLAVLNFSENMIGDGLRKKMESEFADLLPSRYKSITQAFNNHKPLFNDSYIEDDFYNIGIFQDHISGRYDKSSSGGTGMVKLVKALEDRAIDDICYLLSGNRVVFFKKELMEYNDEGWIGFNRSNDFIKKGPEKEVILPCDLVFPGVAYNLQFVMERGKNEQN